MMKLVLCFLVSWFTISQAGPIPWIKTGDEAPGFSLQTQKGLLTFKKGHQPNLNVPVIFFAFSNESAFMENMFLDPGQFMNDLCEYSPDNTQYVFIFYENARLDLSGGKDNGHALKDKLISGFAQYNFHKWRRYTVMEKRRLQPMKNYKFKHISTQQFLEGYMSRLHFVRFTVHLLGNWIPRVLSQLHCYGPFCGLQQISIENETGNVQSVMRRLDARYTWLPSFDNLGSRRYMLVSIVNACAPVFNVDVRGRLALVHIGSGKCSAFAKVKYAQENGAIGVIFYDKDIPKELDCYGTECETYLSIPACVIYDQYSAFVGQQPIPPDEAYIRFQTTPSDTFTFGIDGQGRVQETDWFLYPSMRFAGYQAQWFNYLTKFVKNTTGDGKILTIFKDHLLTPSTDGTFTSSTDVAVPSYKELVLYQNVEVEMSLRCPGTGPRACTRWDHVIRLFISCDGKINNELTRWIAAFERRGMSWITPIRSMLPLLKTNNTCRFSLITESSVQPWLITVKLRFYEKFNKNMSFNSWNQIEKELIPVQIRSLFTGCFFDENCNKGYSPITFNVPSKIARVKLVATITGHGHDNNNCAGSCLTTHRFIINNNTDSIQTRLYKNSATSLGCQADLASENAKSKWMRSREPFCDGQEVIPWQVDISEYVRFSRFGSTKNTIQYRALLNGTDNRPIQNPGKILMSSYLVYYVYEDLTSSVGSGDWF